MNLTFNTLSSNSLPNSPRSSSIPALFSGLAATTPQAPDRIQFSGDTTQSRAHILINVLDAWGYNPALCEPRNVRDNVLDYLILGADFGILETPESQLYSQGMTALKRNSPLRWGALSDSVDAGIRAAYETICEMLRAEVNKAFVGERLDLLARTVQSDEPDWTSDGYRAFEEYMRIEQAVLKSDAVKQAFGLDRLEQIHGVLRGEAVLDALQEAHKKQE